MIYTTVAPDAAISQGDIFRSVPRLDISLSKLQVLGQNGVSQTSWSEISAELDQPIAALATLTKVDAIVITQDCDAARSPFISLCEIDRYLDLVGQEPPQNAAKKAKWWAQTITKSSRASLRYFYLPTDESIGFTEPMGVDFQIMLRLPRDDMEQMRSSRPARLNDYAYQHFRETLSQYLRRYPYDEWYPLDAAQLREYQKQAPAVPFPWQE